MKNKNADNVAKNKQECECKNLEKKVEELVVTIDKVEDEKLVVENQLKKALADYHNLLNNVQKRETLRFFQIKKSLSEEMIPSLDAILLAVQSSKDLNLDEKEKLWLDGIVATLENINKSFLDMGLKQYMPKKGDEFDSSLHEVVATVEQGEKGKVFDIVQPGYTLDDTVIRQARVVVTK